MTVLSSSTRVPTRDAVYDNEGAVSDSEGSCDLRAEVNVPGGIDQIDEETTAVLLTLLLYEGQIMLGHLEVHRDGRGLDRDTTFLR